MSQNAAIDIEQDMFPTIYEGLKLIKKHSNVDSKEHKKAEDLRLETDDSKGKLDKHSKKNITALMQWILKVCSEVVDLLKRTKKYSVDPMIDKIIISLKKGMQYCSQLLSGASKHKSNDITTPAARGNSADLQNATLPSQSTSEIQASTTTPALTNSSIPSIKAENIQPKAAHAINNTQNGNIVPPPPPPPPPSPLTNSIQSDKSATNIKKKYPRNTHMLTDHSTEKLKKLRAAYGDDDQENQYSTRQEPDNNNATANLPTPPAPMNKNLVAEIRAGIKLKKTPLPESTDQKPSSKDSWNESMNENINKISDIQKEEHPNSVVESPTTTDVEDWKTDVDLEIENTDTPSQENRVSSEQSSQSNSIANTLPGDKKQISYVEQEQKRRALNESKQPGKSL